MAEVIEEAVVIVILLFFGVKVNVVLKTVLIVPCHFQEGEDVRRWDLDRIVESHPLLLFRQAQMVKSRDPWRKVLFHKISFAKVVDVLVPIVVRFCGEIW